MSNNPPEVVVHFTRAQAEFVLKNCETNMVFALEAIQKMEQRDTQEKLVALLEEFKAVKQAVEKGINQ